MQKMINKSFKKAAPPSVSLHGVMRNRCCGIQTLSIDTGAARVASCNERRRGDRSDLGSTPRPASAGSIFCSSFHSVPAPAPTPAHPGSISNNQSSMCHFISLAADSTFPSLRNMSNGNNNGEHNNNNSINNYKWNIKEIILPPLNLSDWI